MGTHPRFAPNETQMALDNMTSFATEVVGRALGVAVAGPKEKVDMTGMLCSGGGSIIILKMIVTGMTEAVMLIITALFCRVMFRYGNKPIEEGQNLVFKFGTVRPQPWSKWQSRYYHWRLGVSWMGNFIFFAVGLWY